MSHFQISKGRGLGQFLILADRGEGWSGPLNVWLASHVTRPYKEEAAEPGLPPGRHGRTGQGQGRSRNGRRARAPGVESGSTVRTKHVGLQAQAWQFFQWKMCISTSKHLNQRTTWSGSFYCQKVQL